MRSEVPELDRSSEGRACVSWSEGAPCRTEPRAAWLVIIPSPRSFGSPLPFRFFQRMVAGGRVVENKSRAGAEEANSNHWAEKGRPLECPG